MLRLWIRKQLMIGQQIGEARLNVGPDAGGRDGHIHGYIKLMGADYA